MPFAKEPFTPPTFFRLLFLYVPSFASLVSSAYTPYPSTQKLKAIFCEAFPELFAQHFFLQAGLSTDMENGAEISLVHTGLAKTKKERKEETAKPADTAPLLKLVEANARTKSDECLPTEAAAVPVLTERNIESNIAIANSTNKMVSPVLLKLRRNQEKRVIPANPVNPVQVPPKQFLGFPAERYMSPTDSIMSPISRGLLARSRRTKRLPPAFVPPKALDHTFQDSELAHSSAS